MTNSALLAKETRFVLISQARSGSTMLGSALGTHPQILMHGEIFGAHHFPLNFYGIDENLPWPTPIETYLKVKRDTDPDDFLDSIVFADTSRSSVGFKFKFDEFVFWPTVIDYINREDLSVIFLRRHDLVDRYLSEIEAEYNGTFNTSDKTSYPTKSTASIEAKLELSAICNAVERSVKFERYFRSTFRNRSTYDIIYEALSSSWDLQCSNLLSFLKVDKVPITPSSKKLPMARALDTIVDISSLRAAAASYLARLLAMDTAEE